MVTASNEALTTKTLLHNAARSVTHPSTFDLSSFFDLCALIEACVILDSVRIIVSPDDLPQSALVATLYTEGILEEFTPTLTSTELKRVLYRLPEDFTKRIILDGEEDPSSSCVTSFGAMRDIDYSKTLASLLIQLDSIASCPSIHDVTPRSRVYRSNGYLFTAAANGMDYFPDFDRAPFVSAQVGKLYRSLPMEVYRRVAEALDAPIGRDEFISEWVVNMDIPIPSLSAIVLSNATSIDDIPKQILAARRRFTGYRKTFANFKKDLLQVDSLKRRAQLKRRYTALLEASAEGGAKERITIYEGLNFAQHATKVSSAPLLPTSYAAALVTQPLEWIRKWWINRPINTLFRIDSKLPHITNYVQLIEKHWGATLGEQLLDSYTTHALEIRRLMSEGAEA